MGMDFQTALDGLQILLTVHNFIYIIIGVITGIIAGCLPGVSGAVGLIVLLPATYAMKGESAIIMLMAAYCGSQLGGSIPAILIQTPGTPGAAATCFDGYQMTLKGQPFQALVTATVASTFGGLFSSFILFFIASFIGKIAIKFGPAEICLIAIFGLTILGSVGAKDTVKGLLAGAFGMLLGTIGIEYVKGFERFSFGMYTLYDGIPFITALIGLLAFSEAITLVQREQVVDKKFQDRLKKKLDFRTMAATIKSVLRQPIDLLRASAIGTLIGAIPGEGAAVANFVSYDQARRYSKHSKYFGTGIPQGVIATEAANNAVTGGACIPTFSLGIPGSSVTAILLGVLMLQGFRPGPGLFVRSGDIVYAIFLSLFISNFFMFIFGLLGAPYFARVIQFPTRYLVPIVSIMMALGCFVLRNNVNDILLMLIFGILGYYMKRHGYPPVAAVVGLILSPIAEKNALTALSISHGSLIIFFASPYAVGIWVLIFCSLVLPVLLRSEGRSEGV
jgi:putative tricarboxylic transport membrane protein